MKRSHGIGACLLAATIGWSAVGAMAADEEKKKPERKRPNPEEYFKKMDTNQDGKLSLEEFTAGKEGEHLKRSTQIFARLDKNGDKAVTLEEMKEGFKRRRGAPKKKESDS